MNAVLLDDVLNMFSDSVYITLFYNNGVVYSGYKPNIPEQYRLYPMIHINVLDTNVLIIYLV